MKEENLMIYVERYLPYVLKFKGSHTTEMRCETIEELTELLARLFTPGSTHIVEISRASEEEWLRAKRMAEAINDMKKLVDSAPKGSS